MEDVAKMPEDSTYDDVVENLRLLAAIKDGQKQIDRGQTVPHEKVEAEWRTWITK